MVTLQAFSYVDRSCFPPTLILMKQFLCSTESRAGFITNSYGRSQQHTELEENTGKLLYEVKSY